MADPSADLIDAVRERMRAARVTQQALAASWGVTQGHLSKVLKRKVALSQKIEAQMRAYAESQKTIEQSGRMEPADVATLGTQIMQNMQSALTDLQRLCDGISRLVGKR